MRLTITPNNFSLAVDQHDGIVDKPSNVGYLFDKPGNDGKFELAGDFGQAPSSFPIRYGFGQLKNARAQGVQVVASIE